MADYKVGQVLFISVKGKAQLLPVQVVEQLTKKTLSGEHVSYMVRLGAGEDAKTFDIATIGAEMIFSSAAKAKEILIERVSKTISRAVDSAVNQANQLYPGVFENSSESAPNPVVLSDNEVTEVVLEDGTVARVKLPQSI